MNLNTIYGILLGLIDSASSDQRITYYGPFFTEQLYYLLVYGLDSVLVTLNHIRAHNDLLAVLLSSLKTICVNSLGAFNSV